MEPGSSKCVGIDYINTIKLYIYNILETIILNVEIYNEKFPHLLLPWELVFDTYKYSFQISYS